MYGIGAEFRYKSWTLNVLFKGTGRNKFLYGGSDGRNFDGYMPFNQKDKGNIMTIAYNPENRWISAEYSGNQATENPNARFPRLYYGKMRIIRNLLHFGWVMPVTCVYRN